MNNIQKQNQKKKRKGFTLIELIIVLAVMAIIAAIAIPNFAAVTTNAKKKADIQSCETIKRVSLTLVAQGDMPDGEYTLTPTTHALAGKEGEAATATASNKLDSYFKDVKAPETNKEGTYTITVSKGDVTGVILTGSSDIKAQ